MVLGKFPESRCVFDVRYSVSQRKYGGKNWLKLSPEKLRVFLMGTFVFSNNLDILVIDNDNSREMYDFEIPLGQSQ